MKTNFNLSKSLKTLAALATAGVLVLYAKPAQAQLNQGSTVLTVAVTDVMVLAVAVPAVPIAKGTIGEFQDGSGFTAIAQLTASSNRPYYINVKSNGDLVGTLTAAGESIPINRVTVQTSPTLQNSWNSPVSLSTGDQTVVTSAAGMLKVYDVKYSTAANDEAFFKKGGAYTATLTYTLVAQ